MYWYLSRPRTQAPRFDPGIAGDQRPPSCLSRTRLAPEAPILCLSRHRNGRRWGPRSHEDPVDLAGHVPLQAPQDFSLSLALGAAPCDVLAGAFVPAHLPGRQCVQRPVVATIEAIAHRLARGGRHGATPHRQAKGASLLSFYVSPTATRGEATVSVPAPRSGAKAGTTSETNRAICSSYSPISAKSRRW